MQCRRKISLRRYWRRYGHDFLYHWSPLQCGQGKAPENTWRYSFEHRYTHIFRIGYLLSFCRQHILTFSTIIRIFSLVSLQFLRIAKDNWLHINTDKLLYRNNNFKNYWINFEYLQHSGWQYYISHVNSSMFHKIIFRIKPLNNEFPSVPQNLLICLKWCWIQV